MKKNLFLLIIISLMFIACDSPGENQSCTENSCDDGFFCDVMTGKCLKNTDANEENDDDLADNTETDTPIDRESSRDNSEIISDDRDTNSVDTEDSESREADIVNSNDNEENDIDSGDDQNEIPDVCYLGIDVPNNFAAFSGESLWRTPIDDNPTVDQNSDAMIANLVKALNSLSYKPL